MDILGYLRDKYPHQSANIKYLPLKGCDRCGGNGEYKHKTDDEWDVCICTCVKGWDNKTNVVVKAAARKARLELEQDIRENGNDL